MESLRIDLNASFQVDVLFVDRKPAYNGKERRIPIRTKEQKNALQERKTILEGKDRLVDPLCEAEATAC